MKQMKKVVGFLLAMVLVLGMGMTALAATVTIPSADILKEHTFKAYQVFSGREDTVEEKTILSDIQWGNGIDSTGFLEKLKSDTAFNSKFAECSTASDVAIVLGENTAFADAFAKLAEDCKTGEGVSLVSGANTLADGYYLVVDTTKNIADGSAKNAALLQVVGNIEITVKTDAPTVEKKVKENSNNEYTDVADYHIGDEVPFLLIGSVPDMSRFDTYTYQFKDTLSAGFTVPKTTAVQVYLSDDKKLDSEIDANITEKFTIDVSGQTITISSNDIKTINGIEKGQYILVQYSAVLNTNAEIGLSGNTNKVTLVYSNNPDQSGSGDTETGKTPEDTVVVFTYELDATKVDGKDSTKVLKDAKFVLLGTDANAQKVAKIKDNKFDGWVEIPAEVDGKVSWAEDSILTSDEKGQFKIVGLDAGTYQLREIQAPAGYNMLKEDIQLVISATKAENWDGANANEALTSLTIRVDSGDSIEGDLQKGTVSITIKNNAGTELPSTGGMGTTIFYVVGAILVAAAVILLVTKKRMSDK